MRGNKQFPRSGRVAGAERRARRRKTAPIAWQRRAPPRRCRIKPAGAKRRRLRGSGALLLGVAGSSPQTQNGADCVAAARSSSALPDQARRRKTAPIAWQRRAPRRCRIKPAGAKTAPNAWQRRAPPRRCRIKPAGAKTAPIENGPALFLFLLSDAPATPARSFLAIGQPSGADSVQPPRSDWIAGAVKRCAVFNHGKRRRKASPRRALSGARGCCREASAANARLKGSRLWWPRATSPRGVGSSAAAAPRRRRYSASPSSASSYRRTWKSWSATPVSSMSKSACAAVTAASVLAPKLPSAVSSR